MMVNGTSALHTCDFFFKDGDLADFCFLAGLFLDDIVIGGIFR